MERGFMNCDLISIVIPVYNIGDRLIKTVEACISQTITNIEVIIVDDGSTDNTPLIIEELKNRDQKIRTIRIENSGPNHARFVGVQESKGKYISFVDGDDIPENNMIEELLKLLISYGCDVVRGGFYTDLPNSEIIEHHADGTLIKMSSKEAVTKLIIGKEMDPNLWGSLYRKNIIIQAYQSHLYKPDIRYTEDLLLNYLIFKLSTKVIQINKPYYHYVLHSGSSTSNAIAYSRWLDLLRVLLLINSDCNQSKYIEERILSLYLEVRYSLDKEIWKNELFAMKRFVETNWQNLIRKSDLDKKIRTKLLAMMLFGDIYIFIINRYRCFKYGKNTYRWL